MSDSKPTSVSWKEEDNNELLNFLLEKKRAGNSSNNGLKKKVWAEVKEKLECRGMKNLKDSSCKSHWQQVCSMERYD